MSKRFVTVVFLLAVSTVAVPLSKSTKVVPKPASDCNLEEAQIQAAGSSILQSGDQMIHCWNR